MLFCLWHDQAPNGCARALAHQHMCGDQSDPYPCACRCAVLHVQLTNTAQQLLLAKVHILRDGQVLSITQRSIAKVSPQAPELLLLQCRQKHVDQGVPCVRGAPDARVVLCRWGVNPKLHRAPFFQNGAQSGFEMCFGLSTLGAGAKTRLESRIKQFTPHCV